MQADSFLPSAAVDGESGLAEGEADDGEAAVPVPSSPPQDVSSVRTGRRAPVRP
ncbi:hypothetical protein [Actinomadura rugatobispora]|uniref:Uncharacterized protein n=1 Tax=Actinomadura rugatobispora TaxID=1994 RepID=A0ABW1ABT4_9ACTN